MKALQLATSIGLVALSAGAATQFNQSAAQFRPYLIPYDCQQHEGGAVFGCGYWVAPLDHNPSSSGVTVYVDGYNGGSWHCSMELYSVNYDGTFLASRNVATTQSGTWEVALSLTAAELPQWAYISLGVTLGDNSLNRLSGATVITY